MTLNGKKILLCITGSIAAYKAAFLTRLFIKNNAEVRVVMTPTSCDFISPLTLSTLSKHQVFTDISDDTSWNNHVELGLWADAMVVAPATATTLAKMSAGIADNMVVACYLSAKCPVFFAPAMDLDMWKHPSTMKNIQQLQSYGNQLIPVEHGELASGLVGEGRMADPEHIIDHITRFFSRQQDLHGKNVLITAGPTYEKIDPVRFIGNHSSGKMGIALAKEAGDRGAKVVLILGPSRYQCHHPNVKVINTISAQDMYETTKDLYPDTDISIFAAAVADYTPATPSASKIKKEDNDMSISLKRTKDIAKEMGKLKNDRQINIGFALETENVLQNAIVKLKTKNFDFIVLNSLNDKGAGFQHDTNKITIIHKNGSNKKFPLKSKNEVARNIVDEVILLNEK